MKRAIVAITLLVLVTLAGFSAEAKRIDAFTVEVTDLEEGKAVAYVWSIGPETNEYTLDDTQRYGNRSENEIGQDGTWTFRTRVMGRIAMVFVQNGEKELLIVEAE